MSAIYSPSRSPASSRLPLGGGGASRLRSSSLKKPPEPLRRAVADCLSSSSSPAHHGTPSATASEASRTLREYLAAYPTTDLAYVVILDHTIAERERSPAVVAKCVALLKRYLLRNGNITVKSAYTLISTPNQQLEYVALEVLLESRGTSQVCFSWLVARKACPTQGNLRK